MIVKLFDQGVKVNSGYGQDISKVHSSYENTKMKDKGRMKKIGWLRLHGILIKRSGSKD